MTTDIDKEMEDLRKEIKQLHVQLANCLAAANGEKQNVYVGDHGWTPAYQSVIELRKLYEAKETIVIEESEHRHICGDCGSELQLVRPGKYQCVNHNHR